ncbi:hypothetical protein BDP27DRAFT_1406343 [Rhodocollybia butyracea]|uniref:Uncharacterized protein n=1 Tax=Rhodocollybia butyracea TaxID=206335 RepID=A0A9P5PHG6_9AGAR|nr:hypothetical protein BDP27DRAFT_1406343 [Rhodocollybia butyracea]
MTCEFLNQIKLSDLPLPTSVDCRLSSNSMAPTIFHWLISASLRALITGASALAYSPVFNPRRTEDTTYASEHTRPTFDQKQRPSLLTDIEVLDQDPPTTFLAYLERLSYNYYPHQKLWVSRLTEVVILIELKPPPTRRPKDIGTYHSNLRELVSSAQTQRFAKQNSVILIAGAGDWWTCMLYTRQDAIEAGEFPLTDSIDKLRSEEERLTELAHDQQDAIDDELILPKWARPTPPVPATPAQLKIKANADRLKRLERWNAVSVEELNAYSRVYNKNNLDFIADDNITVDDHKLSTWSPLLRLGTKASDNILPISKKLSRGIFDVATSGELKIELRSAIMSGDKCLNLSKKDLNPDEHGLVLPKSCKRVSSKTRAPPLNPKILQTTATSTKALQSPRDSGEERPQSPAISELLCDAQTRPDTLRLAMALITKRRRRLIQQGQHQRNAKVRWREDVVDNEGAVRMKTIVPTRIRASPLIVHMSTRMSIGINANIERRKAVFTIMSTTV